MEIKPGEFSNNFIERGLVERLLRDAKKIFNNFQNQKITFSEHLIEIYQFFCKEFETPERVFYPCCGLDASPAKAFPNSEIVFLDYNVSKKPFKRKDLKIIVDNIKNYFPKEKFDLLILTNPQIKTKDAIHTLKKGGYIIANNYCGNATEMINDSLKYKFHGIFEYEKGKIKINNSQEQIKLLQYEEKEMAFNPPYFNNPAYSLFSKKL